MTRSIRGRTRMLAAAGMLLAAANASASEPPSTSTSGSRVGAGVEGTRGPHAVPWIGYRQWFGPRLGIDVRVRAANHASETAVDSGPDGSPGSEVRTASGMQFDASLALGGLYRLDGARDGNAVFLSSSLGPALYKEMRRESDLGVRGGIGLGTEIHPPGSDRVAFILEGALRATSFQSERLGTTVEPVLTAGFHYRFGGGS